MSHRSKPIVFFLKFYNGWYKMHKDNYYKEIYLFIEKKKLDIRFDTCCIIIIVKFRYKFLSAIHQISPIEPSTEDLRRI